MDDFKKEIESEISEYKKGLNKKGGSNPIFLEENVDNMMVEKEDVKFLCNAYLHNKLDKWELNYIAEGILLSSKASLENNKVRDSLLALTDPEYFILINKEFVEDILEELFY